MKGVHSFCADHSGDVMAAEENRFIRSGQNKINRIPNFPLGPSKSISDELVKCFTCARLLLASQVNLEFILVKFGVKRRRQQ